MAFSRLLARCLIQEHLRKPFKNAKVATIGKQTILLTFDEAVQLCIEEGYTPSQEVLRKIQVNEIKDPFFKGTVIDDKTFFALFEVESLKVFDHYNENNDTIVHDFNKPIPEELKEKFDYIFEGGVLDHLVNIAVALENMGAMLKPGGRIFGVDACTNCTLGGMSPIY